LAITMSGAKISNSHRGLRFSVAARDIENGQPNDPCACAAALALRRFMKADEVRVYRDVTYIRKGKEALRFKTSPALRLETVVFDREGAFYPGEYDLGPGPIAPTASKAKSSGSSPTKRSKRSFERRSIPNVRPTASRRLEAVE